ncbi:SET domain-containing protein [Aspergillus sclerotiicarbonarius CBS 121057]|uniref:SET domain-containing protein n=1 Tax=Aspergillus sclerotiicarbonarius (strain CBS 121057 / IBT 28362) TaxID=1448318 RepID=A0A319ET72_ASPSB|nr:SET domain-containing protein [Aspergillus sclerotiicarbonarius CBS 121057]
MKPIWWPGEQHELFTKWAVTQGIVINGVSPAKFAGRGLGMIATRKIEKDSILISVPHSAMLTPSKIPSSFTALFPADTPTHALYAAYLTHTPTTNDPWRNTWPTISDFASSMPLLWPSSFVSLLPPSISSLWSTISIPPSPPKETQQHDTTSHQHLLSQQEARLRRDWEIVERVLPGMDWEKFKYHWIIVNTRSFFYLLPGKDMPEDRYDAMALVPVADYFNHSDEACNVKFDGERYVFRAAKDYEEGEEIYMSYGPHPNDFLFTEYGFYLDENVSETLCLDDIIFRELSPSMREELEFHKYDGNYQLTAEGVCYRTEIAAGLTYMRPREWQDYVLGYSTQGVDKKKSEAIIKRWIGVYLKEADTTIDRLETLNPDKPEHQGMVRMLLKRWWQIRILCDTAMEAVSC